MVTFEVIGRNESINQGILDWIARKRTTERDESAALVVLQWK